MLNCLHSDKRITEEEFLKAKKNLDDVWPHMDKVQVDEIKAGGLAIKHCIRGLDAIHLAAALELRSGSDKNVEITFCSFDDRQIAAARAEDLSVVGPEAEHDLASSEESPN